MERIVYDVLTLSKELIMDTKRYMKAQEEESKKQTQILAEIRDVLKKK